MVDRHQDMEGWGVYSIFKEAGRLLYQHFRIFRPFIFAFMLPLALILFLEVIGLAWFLTWVADQVQPHHLGGLFGHHHHHHHFGFHAFYAAFSKAPNSPNPILVFELLFIAYTLIILIFTIGWLLVSLASAAIARAIHHIYSSNNTTSSNEDVNSPQTLILTQSIFTSLPHYFYRIFIISLCFFVVDILTYFLLALPFSLFSGPQFEPYHLQTLYTILWNLVFVILDFWFLFSIQVVVLESQYYGWATLQRSAKLMKAKAVTALGLLGVYIVYFCVLNWVLLVAIVIPTHVVMLYVVAGTLAVGYLTFRAFWLVMVTVFYFVSKYKCRDGREEGQHQGEGEQYQALDVASK